jgi:hypothetical protein
MPLWFEIAVLMILAVIALGVIDMCFALESVTRNFANFGTRLETVILDRLEAAIRDRDQGRPTKSHEPY